VRTLRGMAEGSRGAGEGGRLSGRHHGFDRLRPVTSDRNFVGLRKCEAVYDLDTFVIRRLDTSELLATKEAIDARVRECRHKGARFGGNAKVREASIAEVRTFLSDVFGR
jgi:hypothetical protein